MSLQEVTIAGNDDFLYSILSKCRRNINSNDKKTVSKAYFGLESEVSGKPVEFLECYFNAELKGQRIIDLILKNGRMAHNSIDGNVAANLETTKAIRLLNVIEDNTFYPKIPLQLGKKEMMKDFKLYLIPSDNSLFHIGFSPNTNEKSSFEGEIWIDQKSMLPKQITLRIENAEVYPFATKAEDKMDSVNLSFTIKYNIVDDAMYPELITLNYSYSIQRGSGFALLQNPLEEFRSYSVSSVLFFYDFNELFIPPFFNYDTYISDYQKLELIPYNPKFWEYNKALLLSDEQKRNINFITSNDYMFVSKEDEHGKRFMLEERAFLRPDTVGYSSYYAFWLPSKRIFINKAMPNNKTATPQQILSLPVSSLIKLKTQILLDIVEAEDSLFCTSHSVFEEVNSCYMMPIDSLHSHIFVNIYFDICEIERRKMQALLDTTVLNLAQIEELYEKTNFDVSMISTKYLFEVSYGKDSTKLAEWNEYVFDNLGIDNIAMFREYYAKRKIRNDSIIKSGGTIPHNLFE